MNFDKSIAYRKILRVQADLDREHLVPELLAAFLEDHHPAALQRIRNSTAAVDDAYHAGE